MYFSGIELNDGRGVYPFQETCARLENGSVTAGDPAVVLGRPPRGRRARPPSSCRQQFESGMFHYVTRIRDRRFVAVDRERGIAFAFAFFDNAAGEARNVTLRDGRQVVSGSSVPWTWQIAEAFKIEKGLIGRSNRCCTRCPTAWVPAGARGKTPCPAGPAAFSSGRLQPARS